MQRPRLAAARPQEAVRSGLTNRQLAQSLFVTVKTVETHLAAAYDKLGIRSRQELPDALRERPERLPAPAVR